MSMSSSVFLSLVITLQHIVLVSYLEPFIFLLSKIKPYVLNSTGCLVKQRSLSYSRFLLASDGKSCTNWLSIKRNYMGLHHQNIQEVALVSSTTFWALKCLQVLVSPSLFASPYPQQLQQLQAYISSLGDSGGIALMSISP